MNARAKTPLFALVFSALMVGSMATVGAAETKASATARLIAFQAQGRPVWTP
jgi:hypothetical protein